MASDATRLYWTTNESLNAWLSSVAKSGGALTTLSAYTSCCNNFAGVAVQGGRVYWLNTSGAAMSVAADGTAPSQPGSGLGTPTVLAVDATDIYVGTDGQIARVSKGGSSAVAFVTTKGVVSAIALDADAIY